MVQVILFWLSNTKIVKQISFNKIIVIKIAGIGYKMQQQLFRIRNKDYTKIDQQLYSNMGITEDLDVTLTQLAELQKYLKKQISSIQDQKQREAVMKASKVIGCDLGEVANSCCNCNNKYRQQWLNIHEKVLKIGKYFKSTKQSIQRQLKLCISDMIQNLTQHLQHTSLISVRKANQNTKLKSQILEMQEQIETLKQKNKEISQKLQQWNQAQQRCKDKIYRQCANQIQTRDRPREMLFTSVGDSYGNRRMSVRDFTSVYTESQSPATQRFSIDNNNQFKSIFTVQSQQLDAAQGPRIPMPLRRQSRQSSLNKGCQSLQKQQIPLNNVARCLNQNIVNKCQTAKIYYSSSQTTTLSHEQQTIQANLNTNGVRMKVHQNLVKNQKNRSPNTINKIKEKQNQLLRMKGMENNANRKSTKKLKLFSLI